MLQSAKKKIILQNVYATADKVNINGKSIALKRKVINLTKTNNSIDIFRDSISVVGSSGDDTINNKGSKVSIDLGAGNDYIHNTGSNATINSDSGDNIVDNSWESSLVAIDLGAGNDSIYNSGNNATISAGKGNDTITISNNYNDEGNNILIKYASGDGKDIIEGFKENSTLSISGSSYSKKTSGEDIIVTVGKGKITLVGAANLSKVNIKGSKTAVASWKLSGTTATYGNLVTVSGVKSLDGLSVSGKVVTVAASSLNKSKVTISAGYTLKLASDVTKTSTKKSWNLSGTTATYKQTTAAGYKLSNNVITYTKKATKTLATVNGVKSTNGFTLSDNTVKLKTSSLSKKVSVSGSYVFEFASDYKDAKITGSSSANTIKATGENITIAGGKGNDSLTGGTGANTFIYSEGDGDDIITNYGENDIISLKSGAEKISTSGNVSRATIAITKIYW